MTELFQVVLLRLGLPAARLTALRELWATRGGTFDTLLLEEDVVDEAGLQPLLEETWALKNRLAPWDPPAPEALRLLSPLVAGKYRVIPMRVEGRALDVLTAQPGDVTGLDELAFATGLRVIPNVASTARIERLLAEHYGHPLDARLGLALAPRGAPVQAVVAPRRRAVDLVLDLPDAPDVADAAGPPPITYGAISRDVIAEAIAAAQPGAGEPPTPRTITRPSGEYAIVAGGREEVELPRKRPTRPPGHITSPPPPRASTVPPGIAPTSSLASQNLGHGSPPAGSPPLPRAATPPDRAASEPGAPAGKPFAPRARRTTRPSMSPLTDQPLPRAPTPRPHDHPPGVPVELQTPTLRLHEALAAQLGGGSGPPPPEDRAALGVRATDLALHTPGAAGPSSLAVALAHLPGAAELPAALFADLAPLLPRQALFVLRGDALWGWHSSGLGHIGGATIKLTPGSLCSDTCATGRRFVGRPALATLDEGVVVRLGAAPDLLLLWPVRVRGRTVWLYWGEAEHAMALAAAEERLTTAADVLVSLASKP